MKLTKTTLTAGMICVAVTGVIVLMGAISAAFAHCDTMRGPIIPEARAALEKGDVTPVLKWIKPEFETEVKEAFAQAVQVRTKGPGAKILADRYFIETLIRVHRAGEGAPYTGIKDASPEPIVVLADEALTNGSADELIGKLQNHLAAAIKGKFNKALQSGKNKDKSVEAGREFVEAYIQYMHYVEQVHTVIMSASTHHSEAE
jgi:hypothetical protein